VTRKLREGLDELEAYVTRIGESTGIPASHIEKDFWVTEVVRHEAFPNRAVVKGHRYRFVAADR